MIFFRIAVLQLTFCACFNLAAQDDSLEVLLKHIHQASAEAEVKDFMTQYISMAERDKSLTVQLQRLKKLKTSIPEDKYPYEYYFVQRKIATIYNRNGEFDESMELLFSLLEFTNRSDLRKHKSDVFTDIGMIHYYNKEYKQALNYFQLSLQEKRRFSDSTGVAGAIHNLGTVYSRTNQYDSAHFYLNQAEEYFTQLKDSVKLAQLYNNLGTLHHRQVHDVAKAESYFLKAIDLYKLLDEVEQMGITYGNLGVIVFEQGKVDEGIDYLKKAIRIAEEIKNAPLKRQSLSNLFQMYQETEQYDSAFHYQAKFYDFQDTLNLKEQNKKMAELEAIYQNDKNEKEIEINQLRIQSLYNWIVVAILIIIVLIVIAFYFKQKKKNKEDLEKSKSKFYANIAHEFRTPVSLIQAPIEEVLEECSDEKVKKKLTLALKNTNQVLKLFNQLLDISKLENNKMPIVNVFGDIALFIEDLVDQFKPLAATKNTTIQFEKSHDSLITEFDSDKLEKALSNLISNAVKFSEMNSTVTVSMNYTKNNNQDFLMIDVVDQGEGINENEIQHLFTRFYRGDNKTEGTGLGLSLAKELIELVAGDISLISTSKRGSVFRLKLPIKEYHQETKEEIKTSLTSLEEHLEILVVDDNDDLQEYLSSMLVSKGIKCIKASNGEVGFELAKSYLPDIIISDVMMPVCDGIEMSKKIKNCDLTSHIPIILLSAKSATKSRIEGLQSGAISYMTKPFNTQELMVYIESFILHRNSLKSYYERVDQKNEVSIPPKRILEDKSYFVQEIIKLIVSQLDNCELSVEEVSETLSLSRTQVHRKVKALTGLSASVLIRNIRLEKALELFHNENLTISEISYSTGFNSPSYFSKCFTEYFGVSPKIVKEQMCSNS